MLPQWYKIISFIDDIMYLYAIMNDALAVKNDKKDGTKPLEI